MNCFECGQPSDHKHHVVPKSLGGQRTVPLCESCHALAHGNAKLFHSHTELVKQAIKRKKERGERIGQVPYGYRDEGGRLVRDNDEQEVIETARRLKENGWTFEQVAQLLGQMGRLNRKGKRFYAPCIFRMLNPRRGAA